MTTFYEAYYLANNYDVAVAVRDGLITSGWAHYQASGYNEVRNIDAPSGYGDFNETFYLANNPDVALAVIDGLFVSGWQHYSLVGQYEGRSYAEPVDYGNFNEEYYLASNQDVASAVDDGIFLSGWQHYKWFGIAEGRSTDAPAGYGDFNEAFYLAQNADVAAAVQAGVFISGWHHYAVAGQFEGRSFAQPEYNGVVYGGDAPDAADVPGPDVDYSDPITLVQPEGTDDVVEDVLMWGYTPDFDGDGFPDENNIPAADLLSFLQNIAGIDFFELGLIDDDGVDPAEFISSITIGDITATDSAWIEVNMVDGQVVTAEAALGEDYLNFLSDLIFDADGNSRLYMGETVVEEGEDPDDAAILTPTQNNGWTFYPDRFTTDGDDVIVAGRTELLHGAYIDGGAGYDILEVDMKGIYAQPLQLINIEQVNVQNLPNVYGDSFNPAGSDPTNSVLDLSRATSLELLVVTEGLDTGEDLGTLTVVGIRNGAVARLEGGFTEDVNLHFGEGLGDAVYLELNVGDADAGFALNVAHNSSTLNIDSQMGENAIHNVNFGNGILTHLNITGDAALAFGNNLAGFFQGFRPAVIDASENTGGVDLTFDGQPDVVFNASFGNDDFTATNSTSVVISGGGGDNVYTTDDSETVSITSADGNDVISSTGGVAVTINAGGGNNTITTDESENVVIVTEGGDDTISSLDSVSVDINAGDGNNTITASAPAIAIATGAGDDTIAVGGTGELDYGALVENAALITINSGGGSDIVALGDDVDLPGLTALEGSSISGENVTLEINQDSDLVQADLSGISAVNLSGGNLTISGIQLGDLGGAAFTVEDTYLGAQAALTIFVTEDMDLTDGSVDLADLPANIDLFFDIRNGATLTLSAEDLHYYVAPDGIDSTDGLNGSVVITDAGINFDPFDEGDDFQVLPGGSLTDTFAASDDVTIIRTFDGFNRPEPNPSTDTMTIDTTGLAEPLVIGDGDFDDGNAADGVITTQINTLEILGDQDLVFDDPLDLGDNFTIDFTDLTGDLTLTIANFQDLTEAADVADQGMIMGNGTDDDPVRIDIELADAAVVGAAGNENGFKSSGVQTYVVTDIYEPDAGATHEATVFVCDNTQDLNTLGLQGNVDDTINFMQVNWGTDLLLEGDGSGTYPNKASGDPNFSNIGTLNADYFWAGADVQVMVTNQGTALIDRALMVSGINIANATDITVTIEDGDAVIAGINNDDAGFLAAGNDEVETLTFVSLGDVTLQGNLDIGNDGAGFAGLDASAVDGTFTLELTDDVATDLSGATLAGIEAVIFGDADADLTLSVDDAIAIGLGNFSTADADGDNGTLSLTDLSDQLLDITGIDVGAVGTVTIADVDGTVTLDPGTVLGTATKAFTALTIQADTSDTTVEMSVAQFNQLDTDTPEIDATTGQDTTTGDWFIPTLVLTDAADDSVIDLADVDQAGDDAVVVVVEVTDFTATDEMEIVNGEATLAVAGTVDLTEADITAIVAVDMDETADLTLTADQAAAIGTADVDGDGIADAWTAAAGATLNIVDLNEQALDLDLIAAAGVTIGTVAIVDKDGTEGDLEVDIHADTTFGGAAEIITPTADVNDDGLDDGLEPTILNMTVEQFLSTAGVISGDSQVNLTGLENNVDSDGDFALDTADYDLSAIANAGTLTLADDTVIMADTADFGGFEIVLGAGQMIQFATPEQASGTTVTETGDPTAIAWLFDSILEPIDTTNYDADINTLFVNEDLVDGANEESLWNTLPSTIVVEKVNSSDIPDVLVAFDRVNTIEAMTAVDGLTFDDQDEFQTVENLTINLEGNTSIGNLVIDDTVGEGEFQTLTINSYEDRSTLVDDTGFDFQPNIVGDISLSATPSNELVDITLNTYADVDNVIGTGDDADGFLDAVNVNSAVAERDGLALEVGTIIFGSQGENTSALLTLNGAEDITIAGVDISDDDLTLLTIDNNNTGTVEIGGINQDDDGDPIVAGADNIYVLDGYAGDDVLGTGDTDLIQVISGDVDLTEADVSAVEALHISGDATVTMTADQVAQIGVADFSTLTGVAVTLNITGLSNQALDLDTIQDAGINIGEITIPEENAVDLDDATTLGGADQITILVSQDEADGDTLLEMTATQYQGFSGVIVEDNDAGVNAANVTIDQLGEDQADIDLSTVVVTGDQMLSLGGATGDDDVTLDAAADLAGFTVVLDDIDSDGGVADELAGQTIRFATAVQAERAVEVNGYDGSHAEADTNVVWLFDEITGTAVAGQVDVSDYDGELGRLWVNDQLVDGENVEALFGGPADEGELNLAGSIYVRVVNTADLGTLLPVSTGFDRTIEVESYTQLAGGLDFNAEDELEHVENLTLDLGGAVNLGDLTLDNILAAPVGNDDEFDTLTINSLLADNVDHYLLPESFDPVLNTLPSDLDPEDQVNVIGDISSGVERGELANVTLNPEGTGLEIGVIEFSDDDADSTATLRVDGGAGDFDVTIETLDTSDADIVELVVDTTGYTGTLDVTGGSPAAAVADTETLTITNVDGDITFGSVVDPAAATPQYYAGVNGPDLSTINITTNDGDVDLGVLTAIDGTVDPDLSPNGFELNTTVTGAGSVSGTLGEGVVNGTPTAPTLADGEVWTFDAMNLTITEDVTFNAGGTLDLSAGVTLDIVGDVDLSVLVDDPATVGVVEGLFLGATTIDVPADGSLTMTAAQLDGVTVTGAGTVNVTELEATPAADLSGVMTSAGDTGTVEAALDSTGDVTLTADLGVAHVTISGADIVDATGATTGPVDRNDPATGDTSDDTVPSFTVGGTATLELTAGQVGNATGDPATSWNMAVDGTGTVNVADLFLNADADLSGLTATTVNAAVDNSVTFTGDLGTAVVTVANGQDLQAAASVLDGKEITGEGTVSVDDEANGDPIGDTDLSDISTETIQFVVGAVVNGTITFPTLFGDPTAVPAVPVQTVELSSVQADGQTITGAGGATEGAVIVDVDEFSADAFDLSNIAAGTLTAAVGVDYALDAATDLGSFDVTIAAGQTLTATGAQLSGLDVSGDGNVVITDFQTGDDLSGITVLGTVTITVAAGVTDLTITAAQADGATVTGPDLATVNVTDLEDAPAADLSGLDEAAYDINAALDSTGDVTLTANISGVSVTISGNGTVDGTGATVTAGVANPTSYTVGVDATLSLDSADLAGDLEVAGAGTLSFTDDPVAAALANVTVDNVDLSALLAGGTLTLGNDGFNVTGSDFADTITTGTGVDVIDGGLDNDTLTGGGGNDTFIVNAGSDIITDLTFGDAVVVGGGATATANNVNLFIADANTTNAGTMTINMSGGGANVNMSLAGGANGFTINGTVGSDIIAGSAQDDIITGGGAADNLTGNAGDDVFAYAAAGDSLVAAFDTITDFTTTEDTIDLQAVLGGGGVAPGAITAAAGALTGVAAEFGGNAIAIHDDGGNTTVYVDVDGSNALNAGDMVIELQGVTGGAVPVVGDFLV